jgi:6-pyruvoyl-tetrahydropterin synthase
MRIRLTRAVAFRAFHRLADRTRSPEENRARFGWTSEPHPHHYRCEVSVAGPADDRLPMVIDLPLLDRIIAEEVTTRFDGRHLHRDVAPFTDVLPTCEGLARDVFRRITLRLPPGTTLDRVMVAEDADLSAECLGDG